LLVPAFIIAGFFFITPSYADDRKPEQSFFDRLFSRDRPSDRNDYWKRKYSYEDDYDFFGRPVRIKQTKRQRRNAALQVAEKPEPPLVYEPEKLEALKATNLSEMAPEGVLPGAIYGELTGKKSAIRVTAGERKALVDFYRQNGFRPVWVSLEGLGERGRSVLRVLETATEDGLSPDDYLPISLASYDDDLSLINNDIRRLARLDLDLSAHALRYARHASGGRLVPNKLTVYDDITPETVDLANAMSAFLRSPHPDDYLKSLQPHHPAYAAFKTMLARLREIGTEPNSGIIRPGKRVVLGQSDPRIPVLRRHLEVLGYAQGAAPDGDEALLDDDLSQHLAAFQADARLKPTGMLDAATIVALNSQTGSTGISRLIYNMERLRWLPKELGRRHVFVNQASYSLKLVDDGKEVWHTKVIVGKPTTQTVAFSDTMETIVFNPPWGVPASIMKHEMLPKLRRDPGYLDRLGYRVLTPNGKKIVHSRSVSWWKYPDGKVPYLIQQPPGDDNALGEVKFLFPNSHDIYMHDTPMRELFKNPVRAFSHGCVRVENPRLFAELLLGVDASDIAERIDSGVSQETRIAKETKVHLTYFTAWPADDGRILFYDDIYGRDERMARAFSTVAVASR
jgi:murein L,D-transpeptidase YcbB/YkuD